MNRLAATTVRRAVAIAVVVGAAVLGGGLVAGASGVEKPRRWMTLDGRDWSHFAPKEKEAYVAGFLAGSANAAASTGDTAVIRTTVDSLYRTGTLPFPFGQALYANQLVEFYWWDNHVPIPLYLAMSAINQRLRH